MQSLLEDEGPIRAAFRLTLERIQGISSMGLLDEEALTACLLGGVSTVAPLVEELYSDDSMIEEARRSGQSAEVEEGEAEAYVEARRPDLPILWGSYEKSGGGGNPRSETATGGDFALVIWQAERSARLAVFQAKKGTVYKSGNRWSLNVRRGPSESSQGFTQFVMLFANAWLYKKGALRARSSFDVARALDSIGLEGQLKALRKVTWVHYLAYMEGIFACVPFSDCAAALPEEFEKNQTSNTIEISPESPSFYEVVLKGFSGDSDAWLTIEREGLEVLLPSLLDLMPVHVVDEEGCEGLQLGLVEGKPFVVPKVRGRKLGIR